MNERRYNDQEIAAIFRAAAEGLPVPSPESTHEDGLTVTDLQTIGREVGIPPDAVARAAFALDVRGGSSQRTLFGLPIGVARTVDLNRRMSDEEWEQLVVQLREVFNARGSTRSDGSLRQWTNGNLHVLLEPTETGHRLRFGTFHGAARASITAGAAALGMAVAVAFVGAITGTIANTLSTVALMGVMGLGMVANGAVRLPAWARLRGRQMEALALRAALPPGAGDQSSTELPDE